MKHIIPAFILALAPFIGFCQSDISTEVVVNAIIRDDNATVYENKNITVVFTKITSPRDFKNCKNILYSPLRTGRLESMKSFVCAINNQDWVYLPEYSNGGNSAYFTTCAFGYTISSPSDFIDGRANIILIKKPDGTQTVMIPGYDGNKTLVLKF